MLDLLDRLQTALAGRYAVEREIGHGGMAVVYLARDFRHDRDGRAQGAAGAVRRGARRRALPDPGMSAEFGLAASAPPISAGAAAARGRSNDRRFFTGMAIAAALTVFIGFAPTYYLRGVFGAAPLTTLVHVHGAVATAWILLFLTQTSLIAARRTDLHRRLGVVGAVLAPLLLVVGYLTAIESARLGHTPPGGPPPLAFLAVPIGTLLVFAILVGAGLAQRRRSETHKRLMLLATIAILTPAIARLRWMGLGGLPSPSAAPVCSWWRAWSTIALRTAECTPRSCGAACS